MFKDEENYDTAGYDTSTPYGVPSAEGYESAPYQPITPPDDPTYGDAAYEAPAATAATPANPQVSSLPSTAHTVVKGDTLWGISKKYGVSVEAIQAANNMSPGDSNIRLGSTLNIPAN